VDFSTHFASHKFARNLHVRGRGMDFVPRLATLARDDSGRSDNSPESSKLFDEVLLQSSTMVHLYQERLSQCLI
jgi:hypothetical protein